jgi:hypothetical protein
MIDMTKKYRTRDGREVRIYATDGIDEYPVHGAVLSEYGWGSDTWTGNGYVFEDESENEGDLIEVKPERVVWINEYKNGIGDVYEEKETADIAARNGGRIAIHRVVLSEDTIWKKGDAE